MSENQQPGRALVPIQEVEQQLATKAQTYGHMLPSHISPQRFKDVVMTAIRRDPALLQADRDSLLIACEEAANDGLLPDKKEGALVVYREKRKVRVGNGNAFEEKYLPVVKWMPMIYGIRKKMFQAGVKEVTVELVHENDHYRREAGDSGRIIHEPLDFGDRGAVKGGYAIISTADGGTFREVMSLDQIEAVEKVSKAENGPWKGPFRTEMMRKTILRRLAKQVPLSPEVDRVVSRDDSLYALEDESRAHLAERLLPRAAVPKAALFSDKRHAPAPAEPIQDAEVEPVVETKPAAAEPKAKGKKGGKKGKAEPEGKPAAQEIQDVAEADEREAKISGDIAKRVGEADSMVALGELQANLKQAIANKTLGAELSKETLDWLDQVYEAQKKKLLEQAAEETAEEQPGEPLRLLLKGGDEPHEYEDPAEWFGAFQDRLGHIKETHHEAFWTANKAHVLAAVKRAPQEAQAILIAMNEKGFNVGPDDGQ